MDPLDELQDQAIEKLGDLDIAEAAIENLDPLPENLAVESKKYARLLRSSPDQVYVEELADFLDILAERIQDREDEMTSDLKERVEEVVDETCYELLSDPATVYELLSTVIENENMIRASMLECSETAAQGILDPDGCCPTCGLDYTERAENDGEIVNMALDAERANKRVRELELLLAEFEIVARERLHERKAVLNKRQDNRRLRRRVRRR